MEFFDTTQTPSGENSRLVDKYEKETNDHLRMYMGLVEFCKQEKHFDSLSADNQELIRFEVRRASYIRNVLAQDKEGNGRRCVEKHEKSLREWRASQRYQDTMERWIKPWSQENKAERWSKVPGQKELVPKPAHELHVTVPSGEYDVDRDFKAYAIQFENCRGSDIEDPTGKLKGSFPNQKISVGHLLDERCNIMEARPGNDTTVRYFHFPANNMDWIQRAIHQYYGHDKEDVFDTTEATASRRTKANNLLRRDYFAGQQQGKDLPMWHSRHMRPFCEPVSEDNASAEGEESHLVSFMPYLHWEFDSKRKEFAKHLNEASAKKRGKMLGGEQRDLEMRQHERQKLYPCCETCGKPMVSPDPQGRSPSSDGSRHRCVPRSAKPQVPVVMPTTDFPTTVEIVMELIAREYHKKPALTKPQLPVARVFLSAAKLYTAMDNYRDQKLVEKYASSRKRPPLHPRRTLDQAYHWTLMDTQARDRDQVVYRATRAEPQGLHHYQVDPVTGRFYWTCNEECMVPSAESQSSVDSSSDSEFANATVKHEKWDMGNHKSGRGGVYPNVEDVESHPAYLAKDVSRPSWKRCKPSPENAQHVGEHAPCPICKAGIQKKPRVIMVDQLWMWILDRNTIITCFPKRYGMNRKDMSGVYKTIRQRLGTAKENEIGTAFDIGLIILDECCDMFFDRTKTDRHQPQTLQLFSEAIGNATRGLTVASSHFWQWTKNIPFWDGSALLATVNKTYDSLLNITHEGELLQETKDIIEELTMMIDIVKQQRSVIKQYKKHAASLLDPDGNFSTEPTRKGKRQGRSKHAVTVASVAQRLATELTDVMREILMSQGGAPMWPPGGRSESGSAHSSTSSTTQVGGDHLTLPENLETVRRDTGGTMESGGSESHHLEEEERERLHRFRMRADTLLAESQDRLEQFESLLGTAIEVRIGLEGLLNLKNQQMSVLMARGSIHHGEEAVTQGRSIRIFTVITIIFAPLSFLSAIFGMENQDFDKEKMALAVQLKYIFVISFGIVVGVFLVAFSNTLAALAWTCARLLSNWIVVKLGIFRGAMHLPPRFRPLHLIQRMNQYVHELKHEERRQRRLGKREKMEAIWGLRPTEGVVAASRQNSEGVPADPRGSLASVSSTTASQGAWTMRMPSHPFEGNESEQPPATAREGLSGGNSDGIFGIRSRGEARSQSMELKEQRKQDGILAAPTAVPWPRLSLNGARVSVWEEQRRSLSCSRSGALRDESRMPAHR